MTYYIDGESVELGSELGAGGEGTVYRGMGKWDNFAIKIWKAPLKDADRIMGERVRRTQKAISVNLPKEGAKPAKFVTKDKAGKEKVGLAMRIVPDGFIPIFDLTKKSTWTDFSLSQRDVVQVFINLHKYYEGVHKNNALVGDGNPANFLFNPKTLEVVAVDVDAYQFEDFPCLVGHIEYMAPRQYNKDLLTGDYPYQEEDDWWTFLITFLMGVLRVHPFREGESGESNPANRVALGMHILNTDLAYPPLRLAFPVRTVSDEILSFSLAAFNKKRTPKIPVEMLERLRDSYVECPNHGNLKIVYPRGLKECPVCANDRSVPAITAGIVGAVSDLIVKQLLSLDLQVLFTQEVVIADDPHLCVIGRNNETMSVVWISGKGIVGRHQLAVKFAPQQTYAASAKYLMVADKSGLVHLLSKEGETVTTAHTEVYRQRPVAGLNTRGLVWLIRDTVQESISIGQGVMGQQQGVVGTHVWFAPNPFGNVVAGVAHWLDGNEWFTFYDGEKHDDSRKALNGIPFKKGETLVDWHVIYGSDGGFAIARRTQMPGEPEVSEISVFDHKGKFLYEEPLPSEVQFSSIALAEGTAMYATVKGVYRRKKDMPSGGILKGTENVPPGIHIVSLNKKPIIIDDDGKIYRIDKKTN